MDRDIADRLRPILKGRDRIDIGQFRLLGLAEVRETAGADWPRVKRKVFAAGTQLIENALGAADAVLPCGDGFLVLLAEPDARKAERLEAIGEKLRAFFLGAAETKSLAVETAHGTASAGDILRMTQAAAQERARHRPARTDDGNEAEGRLALKPLQGGKDTDDAADGARIPFFRPIWNAAAQSIAGNACRTRIRVAGRALDGRRVIETRMARASQAELDHIAQKAAFDALMRAVRGGAKPRIRLAIHAETWADRTDRETVLDRFRRLPDPVRDAFLVGFDGLESDPHQAAGALRELAGSGVGLMAEIPFGETALDAYEGIGVSLFLCRVRPPANANSEGLMDHDTRALNGLVREASARGAETALDDVRDLFTLKAAMACGVHHFSGQAVVADRQRPAPLQPLSMVEIYRMQKAS